MNHLRRLILTLSIGTASVPIAAAPAIPPLQPGRAAPAVTTNEPVPEALIARLSDLDPSNPLSYFALGEEFAEIRNQEARSTARRLYIIALGASRSGGAPEVAPLGRSACVALAAIADSDDERRWLLAVARSAAPPPTDVNWDGALAPSGSDDAGYDVAVALGRYRSGEFRRAREAFRKRPDAAEILVRQGLASSDAHAMFKEVLAEVEGAVGCPKCRGERVIRGVQDGKATADLCPVCRGNPAPTPALTPERFALQLRAEAVLLNAKPQSWTAQMRLDGARPLRDVDPESVGAYYGVNPAHSRWQDGAWVSP